MRNNNFRYKKVIVYSVILILLLVISLLVVFYDVDKYIEGEIGLSTTISESIRDLKEQLRSTNDKGFEIDGISYIANRKYVSNYFRTEEFLRSNGHFGIIEYRYGEYQTFDEEELFNLELVNNEDSINRSVNINNAEDPIVEEGTKTNIVKKSNDSHLIPSDQDWARLAKDGILVTGINSRADDFNIESNANDFYGRNKNLAQSIVDYSIMFLMGDEGLEYDATIFYDISQDSIFYNAQSSRLNFFAITLKGLIGSLVVALFVFTYVIVLSYNKLNQEGTFKWIRLVPIEVLVGLIIIAFLVLYWLDEIIHGASRAGIIIDFVNNKSLSLGLVFLELVFIATYASYGALALKSFYYEGLSSFVINKSIFYRILKGGKNFIKKVFKTFFGQIDLSNSKFFLGLFGLGLMFWLLFNLFLTRSVILFIIGLVPLLIIYFIAKNIYVDLREIEEVSTEFSKGNYKAKVKKDNSLKKLSTNLNQAGESLDQALINELESERLKTELITNVSHDLKTPLTSIINYSQLLKDEEEDQEKLKDYASIIYDKSLRLKSLIESLFEVSKINSNKINLNLVDINLVEMLEQAIGEWADKFEEKNLDLYTDIEEKDYIVQLDGQHTYRIFENLFSNIYKYSQEGTRVYIDMEDGQISIKNISKYPLNISPRELLERFKRGDESRTTEGSGLGLSIASSLTEIQGGTFDISIVGDLFMVKIQF